MLNAFSTSISLTSDGFVGMKPHGKSRGICNYCRGISKELNLEEMRTAPALFPSWNGAH